MAKPIAIATAASVAAAYVAVVAWRRRRASEDGQLAPAPEAATTSGDTPPSEEKTFDQIMTELNDANKLAVKSWEKREWAKAKDRMERMAARTAKDEAAGVESLAEKSRKMLAAARATSDDAEKENQTGAQAMRPPVDEQLTAAALAATLPGATEATVAAELARWPKPPADQLAPGALDLQTHDWPLYYDHFDWLDEVAVKYAFADGGEVLRHLIFTANGETPQMKKLIFTVIRCLHCHSGARAGHIPKKAKALAIFGFQRQWLTAVQARSSHPSIEKTVRVLCDYYRKVTSDKPGAEAQLFWNHRQEVVAPARPK